MIEVVIVIAALTLVGTLIMLVLWISSLAQTTKILGKRLQALERNRAPPKPDPVRDFLDNCL